MDPGPGTRTVLFVCSANICRSPMAEFLTGDLLRRGGELSWRFSSAGTDAEPGAGICPATARALSGLPRGREFAAAHRSRLLTPELLEEADLVLVAGEAQRSAASRLSPGSRPKLLTMLEGARIASRIELAGWDAVRAGRPAGGTAEEFLDRWHRVRSTGGGRATIGPARIASRWRRTDVPDVHQGTARRHAPVHADVRWVAARLRGALWDYSAAPD